MISEKLRINYFPVPKIACTSIKNLVYYVEFGHAFQAFHENGKLKHIHNIYASMPFSRTKALSKEGYDNVAVIRDPIKRLLSAYSNRVAYYRELRPDRIDESACKVLNIKADPSPDEFFVDMDKYRAVSPSIAHHTAPEAYYLGSDLRSFDKIYPIESIADMVAFLSARVGYDLVLSIEQKSPKSLRFNDLGKRAKEAIEEATYGDYALLRDFYSFTG